MKGAAPLKRQRYYRKSHFSKCCNARCAVEEGFVDKKYVAVRYWCMDCGRILQEGDVTYKAEGASCESK